MNSKLPYRYRISNWHQLTQCLSNTSRDLSITVTDFIQNFKLSGTRIKVDHKEFGTLFACVVNSSGSLINSDESDWISDMTPQAILQEIKKFGFIVDYAPSKSLSGNQLLYLQSLLKLNFDKIRVLSVYSIRNRVKATTYHIVVFNVKDNPRWIDSGYAASDSEFINALSNGSAMNLDNVSDTDKFDWSWLDYVANISDILADNA